MCSNLDCTTRDTLVLDHKSGLMRLVILTLVPALFALFLVGSVIAEDEVVEDESNVIIDVVLPLALAFIMFSLGIGLTVDDFTVIV